MKTKQTIENVERTFITGFEGIKDIVDFRNEVYKNIFFIISVILSIFIMLLSLFLKVDLLKIVIEFKNLMINFLPSILGFTIAGYTLIVGFVQAGMLLKITEPMKDSNYSLYQKMSATFALTIIIQTLALIVAYIFHFISYFNENRSNFIGFSYNTYEVINCIGLLFISFWFIISLLFIIQIILNIFTFSQLHQYFINKEKIDSDNNTEQE